MSLPSLKKVFEATVGSEYQARSLAFHSTENKYGVGSAPGLTYINTKMICRPYHICRSMS